MVSELVCFFKRFFIIVILRGNIFCHCFRAFTRDDICFRNKDRKYKQMKFKYANFLWNAHQWSIARFLHGHWTALTDAFYNSEAKLRLLDRNFILRTFGMEWATSQKSVSHTKLSSEATASPNCDFKTNNLFSISNAKQRFDQKQSTSHQKLMSVGSWSRLMWIEKILWCHLLSLIDD